jgi:hypothetical protein
MNAVDEFVIYDNIEYTKKGWINRNRILNNGIDSFITIPLKKDSDYLNVRERFLADSWSVERKKMLNKITESYRKAPNFADVYGFIEKSILYEDYNLFNFVLNSLNLIKEYLEIRTPFVISSTVPIDHSLKSKEKVIEICKARGLDIYVNPIGGRQLYNKVDFESEGIKLHFLKTGEIKYNQFNNEFIPYLSIIDLMMFMKKQDVKQALGVFSLE